MKIVIEHDGLPGAEEAIKRALMETVAVAALDTEAKAKERAPVDTGFLKVSIQSHIDAENPHSEVVVGAEYGAYVEYGTVHQAAQPFLTPAAEEVAAVLPQVAGAMLKKELSKGHE